MKHLLHLILVCVLLWAIPLSAGASLPADDPGAAEITTGCTLPGNVFGTPIPSGDGLKLYYSTGLELRVWDQELGIHRRIRQLSDPQQLTGVLLDGTILQCEGEGRSFFYRASDGQPVTTFDGTIRVQTDSEGYSATIPIGDLTVRVFGDYNTQPRMVLGDGEPEPYYPADAPDTQGLEECQRMAQELEAAYGIRVLLWDEVPKDAALKREHLVPVIRRELTVLEQRLSVLPEGLLAEAAAHFPELKLCLVRQRPEELPCGQFWDGESLCIVLESGSSGQELYHGLFHALETRILSSSKALDRWKELNPAGFQYDGDYAANRLRNSGIYLDGENRAFLNQFSMSFPREDRAEVFAYAIMPGNGGLLQSEILQQKLAALCAGLREAFGLEGYEGTLLWEQYLE